MAARIINQQVVDPALSVTRREAQNLLKFILFFQRSPSNGYIEDGGNYVCSTDNDATQGFLPVALNITLTSEYYVMDQIYTRTEEEAESSAFWIFGRIINGTGLTPEVLNRAGLSLQLTKQRISEPGRPMVDNFVLQLPGGEFVAKLEKRAECLLSESTQPHQYIEIKNYIAETYQTFCELMPYGYKAVNNPVTRGIERFARQSVKIAALVTIGAAGLITGVGMDKKLNNGRIWKEVKNTPKYFDTGLQELGLKESKEDKIRKLFSVGEQMQKKLEVAENLNVKNDVPNGKIEEASLESFESKSVKFTFR